MAHRTLDQHFRRFRDSGDVTSLAEVFDQVAPEMLRVVPVATASGRLETGRPEDRRHVLDEGRPIAQEPGDRRLVSHGGELRDVRGDGEVAAAGP